MKIHKKSKYHPIRTEARIKELKLGELDEEYIHSHFPSYFDNGRIIYEVNKNLMEALSAVDINNLLLSDIELPHKTFYVCINSNFGNDRDRRETVGVIEGFYIHLDEEKDKKLYIIPIIQINDEDFPLVIQLDITNKHKDINTLLREDLEDPRNNGYRSLDRDIYDFYVVMSQVITPIAMNFLLYITAKKEDIIEDWEASTPQQRLKKIAEIKNPAKKSVQEEALKNDGYRKIKFVGRKYSKNLATATNAGTGSNKRPHARRGHFRLQSHGKNHEERKVIFIPPTFVNALAGDDVSVTGTIYTVN